MKSIRKTLTRRLSVAISLLVVSVLLAADIAVDTWVQNEFNRAMRDKIGLLETLVNEQKSAVNFEFSGEYLPEFEGTAEPEYFQLWQDGKVFEKSPTLNLHSVTTLPYKLPDDSVVILEDILLPDGRDGRIAYARFAPRLEAEPSDKVDQPALPLPSSNIVLAYATSIDKLNYYLWFIDVSFILALIIVPLMVRFTVKNTVSYALAPLDSLNNEIRTVRFSGEKRLVALREPVDELNPIMDSLNHFIEQNYSLYLREKRLTSDIAHELKTPVTELINMAEVAIKFPGEKLIESSFKADALKIGVRMKSIISSLMITHKYSYQKLDCNEEVAIATTLNTIINAQHSDRIVLDFNKAAGLPTIHSNIFAIESICNNLVANALQYSPPDSTVTISLSTDIDAVIIEFSNLTSCELAPADLSQMFDPLWQKDKSRTSAGNFGLGLSIVNVLADAIYAQLDVALQDGWIVFSLSLPHKPLKLTT